MRVYLDNCCFNRPFDQQTQLRVRLETEAKLYVQERIENGQLELVWSYILDYENEANPFRERSEAIGKWSQRAKADIQGTPELVETAKSLLARGLRAKDALHVACAVTGKCDYFLTTDDDLATQMCGYAGISVVNLLEFVRRI